MTINNPSNAENSPALDALAWNSRYEEKNNPWDLTTPTPEFERLVKEKTYLTTGKEVLIPGSGLGNDALLLARNGMHVSCVEFAALPNIVLLAKAQEEKLLLKIFQRDFFSLQQEGFFQERFDVFLEYTFFCAISPELRKNYVKLAHYALKARGLLIGLFFPMDGRSGGPPFAVTKEEITELFQNQFEVSWETPKNSVKPREGKELLGIFRKK